MERERAIEHVKVAVKAVLKFDSDLEEDKPFAETGVFDSLAFMQFVYQLEKQLPKKIPNQILADPSMNSPGAFIRFLEQNY